MTDLPDIIARPAWQPIETAPKDGTRVLLFYPNKYGDRVVCGNWDVQRYHRRPRPYWTNDNERIWGVMSLRADPPTHWMPLPEPPA